MKDKSISVIYDKYYGKKNQPKTVGGDMKKENRIKAVITQEVKLKQFKIRRSGVLRIGENHIIDKFGFKALQEIEIENPNPGTIIIKGK